MTVANDAISTAKLFAFEQHIADNSTLKAYRSLIEGADADLEYLLVPDGGVGKQKRSIKYMFGDVYPYAFIVNRGHLLFYLRQPCGRVSESTLNSLRARGIEAKFTSPNDLQRKEITFKIVSLNEAVAALEEVRSDLVEVRPEASSDTDPGALGPSEWSDEELLASVAAYRQIQQRERDGLPGEKSKTYRLLSEEFGRTTKAFEFRMQNISAVLALLGRDWISGLKPAKHIGRHVAVRIEQCIYSLDGIPDPTRLKFDLEVNERLASPDTACPEGQAIPQRTISVSSSFARDPAVKAWVLKRASGICESCTQAAPFVSSDGSPYLEVHHLRMLADGGSDKVSNAVALCPNCHRRLHYDPNAKQLRQHLIATIQGLELE